mgnify:CR=1 FL=1
MIATNHSYMLYRFRKELIQRLMEDYEVVISTPFVGHEEDLRNLGVRCIETDVERRSINPFTDLKLLHTYKTILKKEKPDLVITYSIKPNIYAVSVRKDEDSFLGKCTGTWNCFPETGAFGYGYGDVLDCFTKSRKSNF